MSGQDVTRLQSVNRNQQLRQSQAAMAGTPKESLWLRSGNYKSASIADPRQPIPVTGLQEFFGQIGLTVQSFFQDVTGKGYQPTNLATE